MLMMMVMMMMMMMMTKMITYDGNDDDGDNDNDYHNGDDENDFSLKVSFQHLPFTLFVITLLIKGAVTFTDLSIPENIPVNFKYS